MNASIKKDKQLDDEVIRDLIPDLKGYTVDRIKNKFLDLVFDYHISKTDLNKITSEDTVTT